MGNVNLERWEPFFRPFFPSPDAAHNWVESVETIPLQDRRHPTRIMMHQTQRLVSLSDDLPKIRKSNQSLRLLFLLICAEHIAKLADRFKDEGKSRHYVRHFFTWFVSAKDQRRLSEGFTHHNGKRMTTQQVVDALYDVRCDVVHEGKYWGFHFRSDESSMLHLDPNVIVNITLPEFRAIIVRACICAIDAYPRPTAPSQSA